MWNQDKRSDQISEIKWKAARVSKIAKNWLTYQIRGKNIFLKMPKMSAMRWSFQLKINIKIKTLISQIPGNQNQTPKNWWAVLITTLYKSSKMDLLRLKILQTPKTKQLFLKQQKMWQVLMAKLRICSQQVFSMDSCQPKDLHFLMQNYSDLQVDNHKTILLRFKQKLWPILKLNLAN